MKFICGAIFWSLVVYLTACNHRGPASLALERYRYELPDTSRCDTTQNQGVDLEVAYFLLKENTDVARRINDSLRQFSIGSIVSWLDSSTVASYPDARTDLVTAATLFAAEYASMRHDMGGLTGCWELQTRIDTTHATAHALTVKVETFAYTGGAHPNSNLSFYTFDRQTGRLLILTDLFADTTALAGVVEKAFRKQQGLLPQYDLEERGYFLRDGKFFLPANIGFGRDGMIFYYNPYEIAAYALGPIAVTVPYEQLNGIMQDQWL